MKRKLISLLLAITLTASVIGCGKEEVEGSNPNVNADLEDMDSKNIVSESIDPKDTEVSDNQEQDNNEENNISENVTTGENNQPSNGESEGSGQADYEANQLMREWFEDLNWDMTEEEKQESYDAFCAERVSYSEDYYDMTPCRCEWYLDSDVSKPYRCMADDLEQKRIYVEDEVYNFDRKYPYWVDRDTAFAVINEREIVAYEYDGTKHLLHVADEPVVFLTSDKEYSFFQTKSRKVYRLHHESGRVDYVVELSDDDYELDSPYDSKSILVYCRKEESLGLKYYDMETGWGELPYDQQEEGRVELYFEKIEEYEKLRVPFVEGSKEQEYIYEIDENRDLIYWKESEGKENASIIEHDVVAFYQWNEYVFYMVYRTEHKNDTKLYIYWWTNIGGVPAKKWFVGAGGFVTQLSYYEIVGNDEYIFILGDNVVSNYWIEGYLKGNGVELEEGIHNLRVVDYMSFYYDDADGKTHYYDIETDSEQPVPEEAVGM